METSSVTEFTFEVSSAPCCSVPKPLVPGGADLRRAAGRRLDQQVVADGLQALLVDEIRELDLPDLRALGVGRRCDRDHAVVADGDRLGALREC